MCRQVKNILIDELFHILNANTEHSNFNGMWFISKPVLGFGIFKFRRRLKVAWRVLTGKSFAVHFKEDE